MTTSTAVRRFRQRFHDANVSEQVDARSGTRETRFAECLALHGLALWMDIERVRRELGVATLEDALPEVNRRRLAASPMPPSLRERQPR